ncbi:MAG: choice-of-anchor tandem repeat GloVer-containing protein [Terriglobales bacterium]
MHSAKANAGTKSRGNISAVEPRFGAMKLAAAAIHCALALAVLSAVLLITAHTAQAQTETAIFSFCSYPESPVTGCTDGEGSVSSLTFDRAGNLYGTSRNGGLLGAGTVFELSPNGSGGWYETVLYNFTGSQDGGTPYSNVVFDSLGNLYGTTENGGNNTCSGYPGCGVVYELSPNGTNWTETVLYSFTGGTDGSLPFAGLIFDAKGNLFGTTAYENGTVFELSPSGGGWTEKTIYQSASGYAGLTMDAAGNLYGVGQSTVFELSPNGSGGWNPTVIYTFANARDDGSQPQGTLVFGKAGNLFGTTLYGGARLHYGTVYELSPGQSGWTEKILYSFRDNGIQGYYPVAGVVLDAAGNIYGTTSAGGVPLNGATPGTVFEIVAPVGKGRQYKEKVLWSFTGYDGFDPWASMVLDSAGNLYGTTVEGGYWYGSSGNCCGTVFKVTP